MAPQYFPEVQTPRERLDSFHRHIQLKFRRFDYAEGQYGQAKLNLTMPRQQLFPSSD